MKTVLKKIGGGDLASLRASLEDVFEDIKRQYEEDEQETLSYGFADADLLGKIEANQIKGRRIIDEVHAKVQAYHDQLEAEVRPQLEELHDEFNGYFREVRDSLAVDHGTPISIDHATGEVTHNFDANDNKCQCRKCTAKRGTEPSVKAMDETGIIN